MDRLRSGDMLAGKYRVEHVLGTGAMGIVVAATHIHLKTRVAIKLLAPERAHSAEPIARFLREGRAVARIESRHVARVLDVGLLDDGRPYLVMELLEGKTLAELIRSGGPLPVEVAVDYARQVCSALEEAHAADVIHRDLKPANLFVTFDGDVPCIKVLDFGLAKILGADELSMTATSDFLGSPVYMSPEQMARPQSVDRRTDIWSLGAVLYELLTGKRAFAAETMPELVSKVTQLPAPRLRGRCPSAPPALDSVVARCLDKDRDRRYATAGELSAALGAAMAGVAPEAPAIKASRPARRRAIAGAAIAIAALCMAGIALSQRARSGTREAEPRAEATSMGVDEHPAVSTDEGDSEPAPEAAPTDPAVSSSEVAHHTAPRGSRRRQDRAAPSATSAPVDRTRLFKDRTW